MNLTSWASVLLGAGLVVAVAGYEIVALVAAALAVVVEVLITFVTTADERPLLR